MHEAQFIIKTIVSFMLSNDWTVCFSVMEGETGNAQKHSVARLFLFAGRYFFHRSIFCQDFGVSDCTREAICGLEGVRENLTPGGSCGGLGELFMW